MYSSAQSLAYPSGPAAGHRSMPARDGFRLLLYDENPLARMGFHALLRRGESSTRPRITVVAEAGSLHEAEQRQRECRPDVTLVQAHVTHPEIGEVINRLVELAPNPNSVLLMTDRITTRAHQAVAAGACGVVLNTCEPHQLVAAISLAASGYVLLAPGEPATDTGGVPIVPGAARGDGSRRSEAHVRLMSQLTERECEILELVARGWSNAELSLALSLSENTVKTHVHRILHKLGLRSRVHALIYAYETGLVQVRPHAASATGPVT
jgi:DNA-binding NarL/FixJ family response regulator